MTAINDPDLKKDIRKRLERNGGVFLEGVVNKDTHATHLLCGPDRDEGSSSGLTGKMLAVQKMNRVTEEKVHLVWYDWFWDCLEFKGASSILCHARMMLSLYVGLLNERHYDALGPRPKRKVVREGEMLQHPVALFVADPLPVTPNMIPLASSAEPRHQNRPDVSNANGGDEEELQLNSNNPEAAQKLWEGLFKARGFEIKSGKLMRSPSKKAPVKLSPGEVNTSTASSIQLQATEACSSRTKSSLNGAFARSKSFAQKVLQEDSRGGKERQKELVASRSNAPAGKDASVSDKERRLFTGLSFRALGAANEPHIAVAVEARGGTFTLKQDEDVDIILVRLSE